MAWLDETGVETLATELKLKADEMYLPQILNLLYPVGSIYLSVNSTNPGTLFGGTWEAIEGRFLVAADSTFIAGSTGGKSQYIADDMPAHTHTRGTMEIEATAGPMDDASKNNLAGAFYNAGATGYDASSNWNSGGWNLGFRASDSWTGETSQSGLYTSAEIVPPYLAVYMWKRTA